jgi:hypothetical protein
VAGALVGLVLAWTLGGALVLGMVEVRPGAATVSEMDFFLWMVAPLAVACTACASRRVRCWGGCFVAGAVAGWFLGLLTFLGLALLAVV